MKVFRIKLTVLLISTLFSTNLLAQENNDSAKTSTLDEIYERVREGREKENSENARREAEFKASRDKQEDILEEEKEELRKQETIADELEEEFRQNQEKLRVAEEKYLAKLGSLNEIFGHMQSISTDSRVTFESSLTAAEFGKERELFVKDFTDKMSDATELPTQEEIITLADYIFEEMEASGEVSRFSRQVINVDGTQTECEVVRVGVYNAVCGDK